MDGELISVKTAPKFSGAGKNKGTLIVSGGGAKNKFIIETLKDPQYIVKESIEENINSDGLEAYSFSVLGYLRLTNQISNLKNVTGANTSVSLGRIILPPRD